MKASSSNLKESAKTVFARELKSPTPSSGICEKKKAHQSGLVENSNSPKHKRKCSNNEGTSGAQDYATEGLQKSNTNLRTNEKKAKTKVGEYVTERVSSVAGNSRQHAKGFPRDKSMSKVMCARNVPSSNSRSQRLKNLYLELQGLENESIGTSSHA